MRILETDFVCYLTDCFVGLQQSVFYFADDCLMNVIYGGFACLFLDKVTEIVGGEMKLVGTPYHRRQPEFFRFARVEIIVQQRLEAGQYIAVEYGTGGKLTVVETEAVVEQHLDI